MRLNKLFLAVLAAGAAIFSVSCGGSGGGGSSNTDPPEGFAFVQAYIATPNSGGGVSYEYGPKTLVQKGSTTAGFADAASAEVIKNLKDWLASSIAPAEFANTREARRIGLTGHGTQVFDHELVVSNYVLQNEAQALTDVRQAIFYSIDIQDDSVEPQIIENITMVYLELLPEN